MNLAPWLEPAWAQFSKALAAGQMPHAVLLCGPQGIDKTSLARAVVARLVCTGDGGQACGQCRSCQLFASASHPDFFDLRPPEDKQVITVDQVREVIAQLTLTASFSPYKVALIEPAEAMNASAANALLKSLEEPPGTAALLLVSHQPARLTATIRSRCLKWAVPMPALDVATRWLVQQNGLDEKAAQQALRACGGAPLKALEFHRKSWSGLFDEVGQRLAEVLRNPALASAAADSWSEVDDEQLWTWLSQFAAAACRALALADASSPYGAIAARNAAALSRLQSQADRFRLMNQAAVRRDLLLKDWLIEWAALAA